MRGTGILAGMVTTVGVAVALSGCAATASGTSTSSTTRTSAGVASSSTTSAVNPATVAQYASLVAKQKANMMPTLDELLSDNCSWVSPGAVDVRPGYMTCAMSVLTVSMQAQTVVAVLEGAQKRGVPAFVGTPPAEIKSLLDDTLASAEALKTASDAANPCTMPGADNADCIASLFAFKSALDDMKAQFAAWDPYGV